MSTLSDIDSVIERYGFAWPVNLLLEGLTPAQLYSEITRRFPELSAIDAATYAGGALSARRIAEEAQTGDPSYFEDIDTAPYNPDVASGRWRYTISIEGTDRLTGLRAFPQFEVESSMPLTTEQIDLAVGRKIAEWGGDYGVGFDPDNATYIIRSVERG